MEVCYEVCLEEYHTSAMSVLATSTTDSAAFSAEISIHDYKMNNEKLIPICEHCKKQWYTKDQCWKLEGCFLGGKKRSLNDKQNSGRAYMSESAGTSQPSGLTANHNGLSQPLMSFYHLKELFVKVLVLTPPNRMGLVCLLRILCTKGATKVSTHLPFLWSVPCPTVVTLPGLNSHSISENVRFEMNSTNSHTDSKGSVDEIITDKEDKIDRNKVITEFTENKTKQDHPRNISKYDPFLDLPIALKKGPRSCTKHSISNYVSYENLSPQFMAFIVSLDSTTIPKNIHLELECLEWKTAVMEEIRALEKNKT
ncbi:reverse transcriptase [Cucumis melo var. makuwa]|uniref:Reverse transcriptase n=1 Tax=Cucumis melo var. makuwa TaxID=1194695 RepID=A0A5D3CFU0_CUCMM|nr:reverse transcriptase [Cucumis melo var. makuwa]